MKPALCALSMYLFLAGCELILLPLAPPVLLIDAAVTSSSITQPISVVASNGSPLAGPKDPTQKPEGVFAVSSGTLTCKGDLQSSPNLKKSVNIPVRCSNGLTGVVVIENNELYEGSVGHRMKLSVGVGGTPTTGCAANFYISGQFEGPFQAKCYDIEVEWTDFRKTRTEELHLRPRSGAASVTATSSGSYQATVWISISS